jgi:glycosyltransferase involved in cell wall biosynthesis
LRIGIDYRVLAVGEEMIRRGLGRYTQQQLRAVLEVDRSNEYVLLCPAGADISLIDPAVRRAPNVSVQRFAPSRPVTVPTDPAVFLRVNEEFQDWVAGQSIDLYHATTPFVPEPPLLTGFDACPMVATFYDVIPLIFPAHYLTGWWEEQYERTLALLLQAERLIAISGSARDDAVSYLGFPADRIDVGWPVADACFRPLSPAAAGAALEPLRRRVRLPDRFVVTVSHFHHTKNLHTLLHAYSLLSPAVRAELPLVVCCHLDSREAELLGRMIARFGVADCVVATGRVSDEELAALYNAAVLAVHPSRYEGFGLPVAEAMSCGTAVVTTTSSSLPEVAGDAAVLVDADDATAMADSIGRLGHDETGRAAMVERGLAQVRRFDVAQLAASTIESYGRAARPPAAAPPMAASAAAPVRPAARLRLAVWTPLPPQPTGIADYSVELLERLTRRYDVEVFVDDGCVPPAALLRQHRVEHFTAFSRRHRQAPFDLCLYQLGRSSMHLYMREAMRAHPGVVVLHDLAMSHVLYADAERRADLRRFGDELARIEGGEARRQFDVIEHLAPAIRRRLLDELLDRHPMLATAVEASVAQIVHTASAGRELARRCPGADPFVVGMGVDDPYTDDPAIQFGEARAGEALPESSFVIGAFGVLHPVKRLDACIQALPGVLEVRPETTLVLVGREAEEGYVGALEELASGLGVASHVRFPGHVTRDRFDSLLIACDVVVNLRSPTSMHMSATLVRAAAAGKPTIVSDLPEWRDLPPGAFLRVAAGPEEAAELTAGLRSLAVDAGRRASLGRNARRYWSTHGTVERMADGYASVIDAVVAQRRAGEGPDLVGAARGGAVAPVQ